jgi:hypothetical protein
VNKSEWMQGLLQAEKDYQQYQFACGEHKDPDYQHNWIIKAMKQELDIDSNLGFKCDEYLDGYSDYIWQINNKLDRGFK